MADQRHRPGRLQRVQQLAEVEYVIGYRVRAADRPIGIAMTAQVRRHDMKMLAQVERDEIPTARVITAAVQQDSKRLVVIAPVHVMELQALGVKEMRRRPDNIRHGRSRNWQMTVLEIYLTAGVSNRGKRPHPTHTNSSAVTCACEQTEIARSRARLRQSLMNFVECAAQIAH